jgi:hypothetical protein
MFSAITPAQIKQKARIDGTTYNADILDLIDEMNLVVQNKLLDHVDATDPLVKATLDLGFKEVVAGMFVASLANEETGGSFSAGIVKIDESKGLKDRSKNGSELEAKGWNRLKPYLKSDDFFDFGVV